ncbi:hypothetical protein Nmel_008195 [Mimus melanotis]
MKKEKDTESV